jgi:hydroxyacylglutathione hydrolase
MLYIKSFVFNSFQENTYILYDESGECLIIDAGCNNPAEEAKLTGFIRDHHLKPVRLVNTHGHIDHILGAPFVGKEYGLKLELHEGDQHLIRIAPGYAGMWGLQFDTSPELDLQITHQEYLAFGKSRLQIFHVPGHSKGSIAIYSSASGFVLTGDVLFKGSIGRTDLPGGDYDELMESIHTRLLTLPANTIVYAGHGPASTIGEELRTNPFILESL